MNDMGIISMDDYQDREFPGVEAAVLDFADRDRPRRFVPFLAGGNKMYLCASQYASHLQTLLMSRQNFIDASRLTRVRDFNILIMRSKLPVTVEKVKAQIEQVISRNGLMTQVILARSHDLSRSCNLAQRARLSSSTVEFRRSAALILNYDESFYSPSTGRGVAEPL